MAADNSTTYGHLLKYWRQVRNFSQMELALECDTSSRHLSCVETGRAHPSRQLLLSLCSALEIPLRVRNTILISSGYAPLYQDTGLSQPEMREARLVLEKILRLHEPYPAMLIDRCWNIVLHNRTFEALGQAFLKDPALLRSENINLLRLLFHPDGMAQQIDNLAYVYDTMMERARRTLIVGDPNNQLNRLLEEIADYRPKENDRMSSDHNRLKALNSAAAAEQTNGSEQASLPQLIMPVHFRNSEWDIEVFTTVATLGSPLNITLQELQIECAYPVDDSSDVQLRKLTTA